MRRTPQHQPGFHQHGFTLVELVMVIVIMGVVGAMVAVFMRQPIDAYFDTLRRAALSDVADTAVRRMGRDIRTALPNSLRQVDNQCIEFIPTKFGGRYRAEPDALGAGDILNFEAADTSFDMLGPNSPLADQAIAAGDRIAVYNLGIPGADAYAGNNTAVVTAVGVGTLTNETKINFAARLFPLDSPNHRFHVIPGTEPIASYVCTGGNLFRHANYAGSCPAAGGNLLATGVTCNFDITAAGLQRNATLRIALTVARDGEVVNLYHEINVNNTP